MKNNHRLSDSRHIHPFRRKLVVAIRVPIRFVNSVPIPIPVHVVHGPVQKRRARSS